MPLLALLIAFSLLCILFASHGFAPFNIDGSTTMMLDQRDQYIAYLRYYQAILKGDGSLIYTLGKAFGGDFMSIFTYYLASPFNFFIVFLNDGDLANFFTVSAIIKLSFAAMNFYLLCRYSLKKHSPLYFLFAVGFSLMSYNIIYMSNFMYLDVIMVLPLVFLGILFLEQGKLRWLYMASLAYSLATSWYLGAMVCIMAVLFFLTRLVSAKNRLAFIYRFGVFSLIGGLLAAAFWLTAFLHFEGTKATASMPRSNTFFPLTIFFSGWMENSYVTQSTISRNTGYMTMFVGVAPLVFGLLYPFNKGYNWKERLAESGLFLLLVVCSLSSVLSALWHGGREPSWFPTRFSFLMGFLVCYLSAKEVTKMRKTWKWGAILPFAILGLALPIVLLMDNKQGKTGPMYYSLSVPSLVLYLLTATFALVYLWLPEFKAKWGNPIKNGVFAVSIITIGLVSCYRGASNVVEANLRGKSYTTSALYQLDASLSPAFNYVKSLEETNAYRMEATFNRPSGTNVINNNPLFYHYNGLNHYSSSEKKDVSNFMKKLGFHINPFYETYDGGSTSAINSYLGVRYLIDDGQGNGAYEPIFERNPLGVYHKMEDALRNDYDYFKNDYALPLGFVTNYQKATYVSQGERREGKSSVYWYDDLEYQNSIYYSMCRLTDDEGNKKPIFNAIPCVTTLSPGLTFTEDEHGTRRYSGPAGSTITLHFTTPDAYFGQNLYFGVKDTADIFNFFVDGAMYRVNDYFYSGIKGFQETSTHMHTIRIVAKEELENERVRPEVYAEDSDVLKEYLTALQKGGLQDPYEIKGLFSYGFGGTFELEGDNKQFLFTIPYEKEIQIELDGKRQEVIKRNDIFSAISLDGVAAGKHSISIVYSDRPFKVGFAVSAAAVILAVPALIFSPRVEKLLTRKKEETGGSAS